MKHLCACTQQKKISCILYRSTYNWSGRNREESMTRPGTTAESAGLEAVSRGLACETKGERKSAMPRGIRLSRRRAQTPPPVRSLLTIYIMREWPAAPCSCTRVEGTTVDRGRVAPPSCQLWSYSRRPVHLFRPTPRSDGRGTWKARARGASGRVGGPFFAAPFAQRIMCHDNRAPLFHIAFLSVQKAPLRINREHPP